MKRLTLAGLLLTLLPSAGCLYGNSTAPTSYELSSAQTEYFQGTLDVKGSTFYTYVVANSDPVKITLVSLTNSTTGATVSNTVKLGVGVPEGTGCATTFSTTTGSALVAHYFQVATMGTYCVVLTDPGTMTIPLTFAVKIVHS